jgi:hypothetical protein
MLFSWFFNVRYVAFSLLLLSNERAAVDGEAILGHERLLLPRQLGVVQTCYQSDQSDEGLVIDLSKAILRPNLIDLFAKTRVVKSDLIDLDKIELSEFKLT